MSDITQSPPPAGWYVDEDDHNYDQLRWWDGNGWTEARRPVVDPQPLVNQQVIIGDRKRVNHLLHLILTLLTGGLWLPVWIIVSMAKA